MESQPQNPEFRNNPEKLSPMRLAHSCVQPGSHISITSNMTNTLQSSDHSQNHML